MRIPGIYIFLFIALSLHALINYYIINRGYHTLPASSWMRPVYLVVMIFLVIAYPAARFLERGLHRQIVEILLHIGSYYLAIMIFALFIILFIDVIRLGNAIFHFYPDSWRQPGSYTNMALFTFVSLVILILTSAGAINARFPRIRELNLNIGKHVPQMDTLKIALISDVHVGTIINNSRLIKMIDKINSLNPDLILIAGDLFDEDITSLGKQNIESVLQSLKCKYGVFAIPGNHEFFSGIQSALNYMKASGIHALRDSVAIVADAIYLVGRDDRTVNRFNHRRAPLHDLMQRVDRAKPVILMDHQPYELEEAARHGVDLQLSGHTHHGQLIPFNFITQAIYELSWGYMKKDQTHYYVSCGLGTWGPPVRIGNRPEIVIINLNFKGGDAALGAF